MIASEDWKGMREDFRMASDLVSFKVHHLDHLSFNKTYGDMNAAIDQDNLLGSVSF